MKYNIDYIYEPSDLNLLQTRAKILTGEYAGVILDFGGSFLGQWNENGEDKNSFTFNYTLYDKPENLKDYSLRGNKEFEDYIAKLLVCIVSHKRDNPEDNSYLRGGSNLKGKIHIDESFYLQKYLRTGQVI